MSFRVSRVSSTITQFRIGKPFPTGAVIAPHAAPDHETHEIPFFTTNLTPSGVRLERPMRDDERIFGLGEMLGGLNKRGKRYRLFAKDDPHHSPEKSSLYSSHPILHIDGAQSFTLFIDYPGEIIFDIGYTERSSLVITVPKADLDLYVIEGETLLEQIKGYLGLTGKPFLPPRWAFGYQQCRYSYPDEPSLREVCTQLRTHQIPCDAVYVDIDYMEGFKAFTVDSQRFPNMRELIVDLRAEGFRVIPIIDPGIKVEPGYLPYDSGIAGDHFCLTDTGEPFTGAVWPGMTHFPDFLRPETRAWWGSLYQPLFEIGFTDFWNDMNEPAIFFTPESLENLKAVLTKYAEVSDLGTEPVGILGELHSFWAQENFYQTFFHRPAEGILVPHHEVHNLYGSGMARATADGIVRQRPGERYFLLSRSSYAGDHRFTTIWMGDNTSWWEHMLTHIRMLQSLNLCGFAFSGADVGGFCGDASPDLVVRWTALGVFTPLFRNHSTKGSRSQEPYAFDEGVRAWCRDLIQLRYSLLPYLYSEFCRCREELTPFIAPLFLRFPGDRVKDIEDQFLCGDTLLVAPIYSPNARGRYVHLPQSRWLSWRASAWNARALQVLEPGDHYVAADLQEIPVFLRENSLLPLVPPALHTELLSLREVTVIGFVTSTASFRLAWDDGTSWALDTGARSTLELSVTRNGDHLRCEATRVLHHAAPLDTVQVHFEIYDSRGERQCRTVAVTGTR